MPRVSRRFYKLRKKIPSMLATGTFVVVCLFAGWVLASAIDRVASAF